MTLSEFAIIAGGLILGYLVVSFLMGGKKPGQGPQAARPFEAHKTPSEGAPSPLGWSEVLGVTLTASNLEIQAAYRNQISLYHPDKVATLGHEIRALAERKAKEIDAAYTRAKLERGVE